MCTTVVYEIMQVIGFDKLLEEIEASVASGACATILCKSDQDGNCKPGGAAPLGLSISCDKITTLATKIAGASKVCSLGQTEASCKLMTSQSGETTLNCTWTPATATQEFQLTSSPEAALPAPANSIEECDGDCDNDIECGDGLVCLASSAATAHCKGSSPQSNADYCVQQGACSSSPATTQVVSLAVTLLAIVCVTALRNVIVW